MKKLFTLYGLILSLPAFAADPIKEADFPRLVIAGHTFTNAHLRVSDPAVGYVHHDGGLDKIKLQDLPEPARSRFFNPEALKAYEAKKASTIAARADASKAAAAAQAETYKANFFRLVDGKYEDSRNWPPVEGLIEQIREDGILLRLYTEKKIVHHRRPDPLVRTGNFLGSSTSPTAYTWTESVKVPGEEIIYVHCDPHTPHADGDTITITALPHGTYKTEDGRTLRAFEAGLPYRHRDGDSVADTSTADSHTPKP